VWRGRYTPDRDRARSESLLSMCWDESYVALRVRLVNQETLQERSQAMREIRDVTVGN